MGLWMSFIVLNCQVVEWVDIFANPFFKNRGIICTEITKEQLLNSFKIGEMSLAILSYGHVLCRRAHMVKICSSLVIIILIFFACALRHCRVMTEHYLTLKYQAKPYRLKSVATTTTKVTRFYLILLCKQHNWISGTYSTGIIIMNN